MTDDETSAIPTEGVVDSGATATGDIETARARGGDGDRAGTGEVRPRRRRRQFV